MIKTFLQPREKKVEYVELIYDLIFVYIADAIRAETGNLRYQYFQPLNDPETILLIDSWADQAAIDAHHASPMMAQLAALREKYDLHMTVERFVSDDLGTDEKYIRK